MEKRLKRYIRETQDRINGNLSEEERLAVIEDLLIWISWFQHERLVHLLVTLTFGLLTVAGVVACVFCMSLPILIMTLLFLVLLIPYVRHYYILENGVQKLYGFYDSLVTKTKGKL